MIKSMSCPKCAGEMQEGFIPDAVSHGNRRVARRVAGNPEALFWEGAKIEGREQHFIQSFRCVACGYLESYASGS
jgi:predicted nucleic-acid-binding Zn-ribbon protein